MTTTKKRKKSYGQKLGLIYHHRCRVDTDIARQMTEDLTPCELRPEDREFILRRLPLDKTERKKAQEQYRALWNIGMELERLEHGKQNAGRQIANLWLRQNFKERD